jgi:hypothetical protein
MAESESGATLVAALGGLTVTSLCVELVSLVQKMCPPLPGSTDMALGGVPGITYNPDNEATIPVVMPLDPLVTVFNWPQTIWRGETWQVGGDHLGWVCFHLVFADGTSTVVMKSKTDGNTHRDPGMSANYVWDLCSVCVAGGPRHCLNRGHQKNQHYYVVTSDH